MAWAAHAEHQQLTSPIIAHSYYERNLWLRYYGNILCTYLERGDGFRVLRDPTRVNPSTSQKKPLIFYTRTAGLPPWYLLRNWSMKHIECSERLPAQYCAFVGSLFANFHPQLNNQVEYRNLRAVAGALRQRTTTINLRSVLPQHLRNLACTRLLQTELSLLYWFWLEKQKKASQYHFDPNTTGQLRIHLLSNYDICDYCTYSLLQAGLGALFGLGEGRVHVTATTWRRPQSCFALWGRTHGDGTPETKRLHIA